MSIIPLLPCTEHVCFRMTIIPCYSSVEDMAYLVISCSFTLQALSLPIPSAEHPPSEPSQSGSFPMTCRMLVIL